MNHSIDELYQAIHALPLEQQHELVRHVAIGYDTESIDYATHQQAWNSEISARVEAIDKGSVTLVDGESFLLALKKLSTHDPHH